MAGAQAGQTVTSFAVRRQFIDGGTVCRFRPRNIAVRAMLPLIRRKSHQTQRNILGGLDKATARRA